MDNDIPTPGSTDSGVPLYEGVSAEWNDVLSAVPEDRRSGVAEKIKTFDTEYNQLKGSYEPWKPFITGGVDPEYVETAVKVLSMMETQPHQVYETMGKYLNQGQQPPPAAPKVPTGNVDEPDDNSTQIDLTKHPEFQKIAKQQEILAQIALAQKEQERQSKEQAAQDKALDDELNALKKKYGEFPEDEITMRMAYKDMTAEEAYQEFSQFARNIRTGRPAPYVLGGGGQIPRQPLDVKKLDSKATKDLVVQMLEQQG